MRETPVRWSCKPHMVTVFGNAAKYSALNSRTFHFEVLFLSSNSVQVWVRAFNER
jgi:hypothetical protein